jgi:hypothetical protein
MRGMGKLGIAVFVVALSGCSVLFMEKPPEQWKPPQPLHCTTSTGWSAWDMLQAVGHAVVGGWAVYERDALGGKTTGALVSINGFFAIAHGASAVYGSKQAARCQELRDREAAAATPP